MTINEKFLPTEQKPKFDIVTALLVLLFVVVRMLLVYNKTSR